MNGNSAVEKKRGRRWRRLIFLSLALFVVIGSFYLWSTRVAVVEERLDLALRQAGLDAFSVRIEHVGLSGASISSFQIGDPAQPALIIDDIRVFYTLSGLLAQQLSSIEIGMISLDLSAGPDGIDLGPLALLTEGPDSGTGLATGLISVGSFLAKLSLPQGVVQVKGMGAVEQEDDGYRIELGDGCIRISTSAMQLGGLTSDPLSKEVCLKDNRTVLFWPPRFAFGISIKELPVVLRDDQGTEVFSAEFMDLQSHIDMSEKLAVAS